ncbi:MAG TPA: hypothetical protein VFB29_00470 [Pseudolabrys sp.]|nr:hypothetical protein [Pseudolabrys sp.]
MRKLALAGAMALALFGSGCANVQNAWNVLTEAQVSPQVVLVAANTFDALEATATNYLRLPKCTGTNGPVCRSAEATAKLIPAIRAGRVARNNLEQFLTDHPGSLGPQGLYDSMQASITTLQTVLTQYNVH